MGTERRVCNLRLLLDDYQSPSYPSTWAINRLGQMPVVCDSRRLLVGLASDQLPPNALPHSALRLSWAKLTYEWAPMHLTTTLLLKSSTESLFRPGRAA